jgi:hypothetical protein
MHNGWWLMVRASQPHALYGTGLILVSGIGRKSRAPPRQPAATSGSVVRTALIFEFFCPSISLNLVHPRSHLLRHFLIRCPLLVLYFTLRTTSLVLQPRARAVIFVQSRAHLIRCFFSFLLSTDSFSGLIRAPTHLLLFFYFHFIFLVHLPLSLSRSRPATWPAPCLAQ